MTTDLSVIGIVFAIILFIVFFAAIILYLSFRIKETFREEKKRGMLIVKVAFLIGILFLAGGSLYFFAQILSPSTPVVVPSENNTIPNGTSPAPSTNDTSPTNDTQEQIPRLSLFIAYPAEVRLNNEFTITFTITNPTESAAHDVIIQASSIFENLNVTSSSYEVTGNLIDVGDVVSGTTIVSLKLIAQNRPGTIDDNISLTFTEMDEPITESVSISIRGGP
jgi:hypothetical protein